jgi:Arc/MetJ-type ribon-helix-helix transcriptional regulator
MVSMKLSVSLPDEDVEFLDEYARTNEVESRSAVIRRALRMLRSTGLEDAYVEAFEEWNQTEAEVWEVVVGDGLTDDQPG